MKNKNKERDIEKDILFGQATTFDEKEILCHAIGNRGLAHAWGVGKTEKEAEEQCRLAVQESLEENKTKWRHAPFKYVIQ
tara:strand:- start:45 stop:284 length:240 start_codon:yes stop_codon:yes gene_type:complete